MTSLSHTRDLILSTSTVSPHRHAKKENTHCCGGKAYNIKDPQMKCCAGTLHNLTLLRRSGHDVQCCGSILQTPHVGFK